MNLQTQDRRAFLRQTAFAALGAPAIIQSAPAATAFDDVARRRVLVLGIDGLSPYLLEQAMAAGRMPHIRSLIARGDYAKLRTSNPPQSPVAWSNFITGMHPGRHGIYDFIHRDPQTMQPCLSMSRSIPAGTILPLGNWQLPLGAGRVELLRRGPAFWKELSEAGVSSTLYRLPVNFPPVPCSARSLSGMGAPDLVGAYGVSTYITDAPPPNADRLTDTNVRVVTMDRHGCEVALDGPPNPFRSESPPTRVSLTIDRDPVQSIARIDIQGTRLLLSAGEWSDWIPVRFDLLGRVSSVQGMIRLFVKELHPHLKVYVSPINIDPADPALPISTPEDFSKELARTLGPFHTQGIAEDTRALSNGILSDGEFLSQAMSVLDENLEAYDYLLKTFDRGFLFFYFSSLDLNSHMFWRAMDPRHPLYTPELGRQHGKTLEDLYARMDDVVGQALERIDDETTVIIMSDHGFQPFYRTFNLNTWLKESGYARTMAGAAADGGKYLSHTDWNRTVAYGLGINSLYINRRGREATGLVGAGRQTDALIDELARKLAEVRDPETGETVMRQVYKGREIFKGPAAEEAPDLVLGYADGYRASWETVLGTYAPDILGDNNDKWSGDHCMDPANLSGVLITNRKLKVADPALTDLAPTILAQYGLKPPPETEGRVVL